MLASPIKINQRIGMGLGLQQLRYDHALQPAEGGGRSHLLARRSHGIDSNMGCEVHGRPGHRLEGTTVPVRGERTRDGATLHAVWP